MDRKRPKAVLLIGLSLMFIGSSSIIPVEFFADIMKLSGAGIILFSCYLKRKGRLLESG
jgi:hypothetical protein